MKTPLRSLSPALLLSALAPFNLQAADKHVHGEAELFVAIEKNQVLIELESPADNILGFEHQPRTAQQKAAVKKGLAVLQNASNLIKITEGNCKQSDAFIESPFTGEKDEHHHDEKHDHGHDDHGHEKEHAHHDDHHHEEHKHDDDHHHAKEHKHEDEHHHDEKHDHDHHDHGDDKDAHSEFHATYTLDCKDTNAIKSATVSAFESFNNFQKITVNWVTSKGQGSVKTSAKKTQVNFK